MGHFKIEFSKTAAKDYKKLPRDYKALIDLALQKLSDGIPVDIKPITRERDSYRIRRVTLSEYEAEMTNRQLLEVPLNL